jgi:dipeptide/tripeptide permease
MIVLTLTAALPALQPPPCAVQAPPHSVAAAAAAAALPQCQAPSTSLIGVLILAFALLTIGAGGVRPCSLPFGVDQFDAATATGRRDLISFFNWYYATTSFGIMIALTIIVYVQDEISWTIGFAVPTGLMLCAIILFFAGTKYYVHVAPEGSVFSGIAQVFVAAYKKRNLELPSPEDPRQLELQLYNPSVKSERVMKLHLTLQFKWLNKAAIIERDDDVLPEGSPADRWRLAGVQQIEEVKCLLRIIPIWASGVTCFVAISQQWTFGVLQSMTMDRKLAGNFQIPPTSLVAFSPLVLALFIPIYDKLLVPAARKFTGRESGITLLQRQGVGLFLASLTMVVAGISEAKRRSSAMAHGGVVTPMSALWLTPQLGLAGIAEAFNAVGQIEFYNKQFPEHMQTLANALFCLSFAFAGYISAALVGGVQRNTDWLKDNITAGRLDYYYYLLAVFGFFNLVYFTVCAHFYRYKGTPEVGVGDSVGGDEKVDGAAVP